MIHYTDRLTALMRDIVARVPTLSFIDMRDVLVFARFGRSGHAGPVATCHCLSLPPSEPGYYFWRDEASGTMTRRSDWFVSRSPSVVVNERAIKYLISFALPRFCNRTLARSRKSRFYSAPTEAWISKLDTVVHELYHIDPGFQGIRRLPREDGTCSNAAHTPEFFAHVSEMVMQYLDSDPDPSTYDFLRADFALLASQYGGVVGTSFRPFPSYPQRYIERLDPQPPATDLALAQVEVAAWRETRRVTHYTDAHLQLRQFFAGSSRRRIEKRSRRAA